MTITITPGTVTSLNPDTVALHPFDALNQSLINYAATLVPSTNMSDRSVIRIPYTNPGEVDFVAEGDVIPETETDIDELTIPSRKIASIKTVSNEALRNDQGDTTRELIINQATEDIVARAERSIFGVDLPDDSPLTALQFTEGLTDLGTIGTNLDPFIDGIANIVANGGKEEDIRIVCNPKAWAHIAKMKDSTNGNRALADTVTASTTFTVPNPTQMTSTPEIPVRTLLNIPLFVSPHMIDQANPESGAVLMFDSKNVVAGATNVEIAFSTDHAFRRDAWSARSVYRLGWKVFKPARLNVMTTAA